MRNVAFKKYIWREEADTNEQYSKKQDAGWTKNAVGRKKTREYKKLEVEEDHI